MDALTYAGLEDSLDYLYAFLDSDLLARIKDELRYIPAGMEDFLLDDSLEDFVWLWFKDSGANGFRQYLADGGFDTAEVEQAYVFCRAEWGMNTPPQVEWLREDGFDLSPIRREIDKLTSRES